MLTTSLPSSAPTYPMTPTPSTGQQHSSTKHCPSQTDSKPNNNVSEQSVQVSLSSQGKALLHTLQAIDEKDHKPAAEQPKTVKDNVESFAHGALGIEHPKELAAKNDTAYSAGQYLSAAATVGGIVLMIV